MNGADVTVTINDDGIFINDAQVTVTDIVTDNGVVHVIDAVLLPPTEPETYHCGGCDRQQRRPQPPRSRRRRCRAGRRPLR